MNVSHSKCTFFFIWSWIFHMYKRVHILGAFLKEWQWVDPLPYSGNTRKPMNTRQLYSFSCYPKFYNYFFAFLIIHHICIRPPPKKKPSMFSFIHMESSDVLQFSFLGVEYFCEINLDWWIKADTWIGDNMGQSGAMEDADRDAENKHAPEVPMADSSMHLVGPEPRAVPTQLHPSSLGHQHHSCLGYGSQSSSLSPLYPSSCPISLQSSEGHIVSQPRARLWTLMSP